MGTSKQDKAAAKAAAKARARAEAAWKAAQADVARHDAEFEETNPNWEQQHGGGSK